MRAMVILGLVVVILSLGAARYLWRRGVREGMDMPTGSPPSTVFNFSEENIVVNETKAREPAGASGGLDCNCWPVESPNHPSHPAHDTHEPRQHQPGGYGHRPKHYKSRHGASCHPKNKAEHCYDFTKQFPTRKSVTGFFTENGIPGAAGYQLVSPYH